MRDATDVVHCEDFTVSAVTCRDDHAGWSAAEPAGEHRIVLVRRGRFRRWTRDGVADLDPTRAYLDVPDEEARFAHPAGGDVCTAVRVRPSLWLSAAGEVRLSRSTLHLDARLDLAHRRLLRAEDPFAAGEVLVDLLARAVAQVAVGATPTGPADRAAVDAARAAVLVEHPDSAGLVPLARLVGVSPHRLSRAFSREVGMSLTRFRNRVRVGRALDRLEAGERDLAGLAADLGFADQAHLTRTVRAHVGWTPAALRAALAPSTTGTVPPGARRAGW
ncbi:AraC-like DNA-binding protein [Saccharothrix coeruleofusca]|uniref:helix-turn-helix domain-containing protein n=1 Tax=Saccharothrix coeruleofusca TaxID=33919 RepID=UPI0027DC040E|nr:AraC family transcriptional regulator [Saccharothrix coeruleofusca]MBP2335150.1 AraC-like DNA-binding protein [Saccharothrix coeruleofusca]